MSKLQSFMLDQSAATAIEYALIAGSISIVIVAAATNTGSELNNIFTQVLTGL